MLNFRIKQWFSKLKLLPATYIALAYFIFSFLWILFSDKLLIHLTQNQTEYTFLQTLKGWIFITASTLLIYALIRNENIKNSLVLENLNAQKAQLSNVLSNLPNVVIFLFDNDGDVQLKKGNKKTISLIEKTLLSSEQFRPKLKNGLKTVFAGHSMVREITFGEQIYEWRLIPLQQGYDSKVQSALAIVVDISSQKRTERNLQEAKHKAEESEALKTAFLANLSHEVRTPLNSIMGFSELISQHGENQSDMTHFSKIIRKSSTQLTDLIDNLLEVSKIQLGKIQRNFSIFSVNELLRNLSEYFEIHSAIIIECQYERPDGEEAIVSDPKKIHQIFLKLISNALKFTLKGKITLGYLIEKKHITFHVADTGPGIPMNKRHVIFDPFRQADDSDTREFGGAGLGLTIAKGLVDVLDGKIWFESEKGSGTTFFFKIPVEYHYHGPEPKLEIMTVNPIDGKRILIVEDDYTNFELMNEILIPHSPIIFYAENAYTAIKFCEEQRPDIVLFDLQLYGRNGLELIRELVLAYPEIIIIGHRVFFSEKDIEDSLEAGCKAVLKKPIVPENVLSTISQFC